MRICIHLIIIISFFLLPRTILIGQDIQIARLMYRGGGDWYNDPSALKNLLSYASKEIPLGIDFKYKDVAIGSSDLYRYPFAFMTGHGGFIFNESEVENVREYLLAGGFLHVDDDYGFDNDFRKFAAAIFPNKTLTEIAWDHPIFNQHYSFKDGIPKIHEHDGKAPQAFGLFHEQNLILLYTYESNLSDGWADASVHKNPESIRKLALQMGTNILLYAINGE